MPVPVLLTRRALKDLREVESYSVREWGRKTAGKYLSDLESAFVRLRSEPEILRLEPDLARGLYFYRVRRHVLACDYSGDTIVVLTVMHASMDIPTRLSELEPRLVAEVRLLREKTRRVSDRE